MDNQSANENTFTPRVVVYRCSWCASAAEDMAGGNRLQLPDGVQVIPVNCTGSINPLLIVKTLQQKADGVLVVGCNPGDCHYRSGNKVARRKFAMVKNYLQFVGLEPERVQFGWVSGSEGTKFTALIEKICTEVRALGPSVKLVKKA